MQSYRAYRTDRASFRTTTGLQRSPWMSHLSVLEHGSASMMQPLLFQFFLWYDNEKILAPLSSKAAVAEQFMYVCIYIYVPVTKDTDRRSWLV